MNSRTLSIIAIVLGAIFLFLFSLLIFGLPAITQTHKRGVAIVEVSGPICDSREIVRQIKKFTKSPQIKAIVIRIDSPGGAVGPVQEVFSQIKEARKEGKKVVASMGSVAASGGLYIALACERIVANPGTMTGSIGVIMNFPIIEELLRKLGISFETIKSREYKDIGSPFRPMKPDEKDLLKGVVDDVYQEFVAVVAKERNLSLERTREIADGRIFSGKQALEFGLVDTLGSLETAITLASQMAGIKGEPEVIRERRRFSLWRILENLWTRLTTPKLLYLIPPSKRGL